jgi:hypothetical protein
LAGYTTTGASAGFTLVCDDEGTYSAQDDTGNLQCQINTCYGSVRNGEANVDYSSCTLTQTGDECIPKCESGFATPQASAGFVMECDENGNYNVGSSGNIECVINTCGGNITNGVSGADYSSCSSSTTTGGTCKPVCMDGHTASGASAGFALVCDDEGHYSAQADQGDLSCAVNACLGVTFGATNVDYSSCTVLTETGDTCTPECPSGFTTTRASDGFTLVCNEANNFDARADGGNLQCSSNTCVGNVIDGAANADYSSCSFAKTGDMCIPECDRGFATTQPSTGFTLLCDANGNYNAGDSENLDLECAINSCGGSVTNGVAGADYSSCSSSATTGGTCTPICLAG